LLLRDITFLQHTKHKKQTIMSTVNKLDAIKWLSNRPVISAPGKYTAKVTSCQDFNKVSENGTVTVAIANFNVMNMYQATEAKKAIQAGNYDDAVNKANLSLGIRSTDFRPAKGELVNIIVEEITTKSGEKALLVTSVSEIQAKTASTKMDFSLEEDLVAEAADPTSMD